MRASREISEHSRSVLFLSNRLSNETKKSYGRIFVYAIVSKKDGVIYVGMASDCEIRLKEHNLGKSKFTSGHMPWRLFYSEFVGDAKLARAREKYLKSASGKRKLKAILTNSEPAPGSLPD